MASIFITGSADSLGQLAASQLVKDGHDVVLHARSIARGEQALKSVPGAQNVLIADLAVLDETKALAGKANTLRNFDVVIHNAGVYLAGPQQLLNVNTLAPYVLTSLMHKPKRLIYLSSGMHLSGKPAWTDKPSYSDTKLHVLMLTRAVARIWAEVFSNALDPGWVPTKMGGSGAPDDLEEGYRTQVLLATSSDPAALVSGKYFHHQRLARYHAAADDTSLQDQFLKDCARVTGVPFP